jgi:integrase
MAAFRTITLKSGKTSYQARIHRGGLPALQKCFPSMKAAREWATATEARLDKGETVSAKAERFTVAQALASYAADHKDKLLVGEPGMLKNLSADLGEFAVSKLSRDILKNYIEQLLDMEIPLQERKKIHPYYNGGLDKDGKRKKYAKGTVRKYYLTLKKALELHAIKERYVLPQHLFARQDVPPAWEPNDRRLNDGDEKALYSAVATGRTHKDIWPLIIGFALETAARCQEISLAEWKHISFDNRTWWIPPENVKIKKGRQIPLSRRAVEILRQLEAMKISGSRLFPQWESPKKLSKAFHRLAVRAKIPDVHFHTLRHEATSRFFEKGTLDMMEVASITGHSEMKTLQRYTHLLGNKLVDKMG